MSAPSLRAFSCGATHMPLAVMFAGEGWRRHRFPSWVYLLEDGERKVLFDTGYALPPWRTGVAGVLYRALLPPQIRPEERVDRQLADIGIAAADITHVVATHLHPDHVGGLELFPDAEVIMTQGQTETIRSPRLTEGFLPGLLPPWLLDRATVLGPNKFGSTEIVTPSGERLAVEGHDLFGDGSVVLIPLPGHAQGQIGALIRREVLLAADASWSRELLGAYKRMRFLPRTITFDFEAYAKTQDLLLDLESRGVRLYFSHASECEDQLL